MIKNEQECKVEVNKEFSCNKCGDAYSTNRQLKYHSLVHSRDYNETVIKTRERNDDTVLPSKPFSCNTCQKRFLNLTSLTIHLRSHTKERPFKCQHCPKSFSTNSYLIVHTRLHTGVKPYRCTRCNRGFICKERLDRHITEHTGSGHQCPQCPKRFFKRATWQLHQQIVHEKARPHLCQQCGKLFPQYSGLKAHLLHHYRLQNGLGCQLCSMKFSSASQLERHNIRLHGEYKCKICNRCFLTERAKALHEKYHDRTLNCTLCSARYISNQALEKHQRFKHWQELGLQKLERNTFHRKTVKALCYQAKEVYNSDEKQLDINLEENSTELETEQTIEKNTVVEQSDLPTDPINDSPIEELRNNAYRSSEEQAEDAAAEVVRQSEIDDLECDTQSDHYTESIVIKGQCQDDTLIPEKHCTNNPVERQPTALKQHDLKPRGPKINNATYACDKCEKTFKAQSGLDYHRRVHPEYQKFSCTLCSQQYYAKNHLTTHIRTVHNADLLECSICRKQIKGRDGLRSHKLIHENLKKYVCPLEDCRRTFNQPGALWDHKRKHHPKEAGMVQPAGKQLFICEYCGKQLRSKQAYTYHLDSHREDSARDRLECNICSKMFKNRINLSIHVKAVHGKAEKKFKCEKCFKLFKTKRNLMVHEETHTARLDFRCNACGKRFRTKFELRDHLDAKHEIVLKIACTRCEMKFKTRQHLYYHLKTKHANKN